MIVTVIEVVIEVETVTVMTVVEVPVIGGAVMVVGTVIVDVTVPAVQDRLVPGCMYTVVGVHVPGVPPWLGEEDGTPATDDQVG